MANNVPADVTGNETLSAFHYCLPMFVSSFFITLLGRIELN